LGGMPSDGASALCKPRNGWRTKRREADGRRTAPACFELGHHDVPVDDFSSSSTDAGYSTAAHYSSASAAPFASTM
jgi:hypothetical protein